MDYIQQALDCEILWNGKKTHIETIVSDCLEELPDNENIGATIADTNAVGWSLDDYEVTKIEMTRGRFLVHFSAQLTGEQEDDKMFCGDKIQVTGQVEILEDGTRKFINLHGEVPDDR
jgi:hypothetical protein